MHKLSIDAGTKAKPKGTAAKGESTYAKSGGKGTYQRGKGGVPSHVYSKCDRKHHRVTAGGKWGSNYQNAWQKRSYAEHESTAGKFRS